MLTRVRRVEVARAPVVSPVVKAFGSFEALAEQCDRDIEAGKLDPRDFPIVLNCLARWEREGIYGLWRRDGRWQLGAK